MNRITPQERLTFYFYSFYLFIYLFREKRLISSSQKLSFQEKNITLEPFKPTSHDFKNLGQIFSSWGELMKSQSGGK
jgi:hypothetical protein